MNGIIQVKIPGAELVSESLAKTFVKPLATNGIQITFRLHRTAFLRMNKKFVSL